MFENEEHLDTQALQMKNIAVGSKNENSCKKSIPYTVVLHAGPQRRHRCEGQTFGLWEKARVA